MRPARLILLIGAAAALGIGVACSSFDSDSNNPTADAGDAGPNSEASAVDGAVGDAPGADPCVGVDLTGDPRNCGACGHDCLGGACDAGQCGVFRAGVAPTNLTSIGVTSSGIYWADYGATDLRQCPLAGCPDGGATPFTNVPSNADGLIAFGDQLAVWDSGHIWIVSTPGGTYTPLVVNMPKAFVPVGNDGFAFIHYPGGQSSAYFYKDEGGGPVPFPQASMTSLTVVDRQLFAYELVSPERIFHCDLGNLASCAAPIQLFGAGQIRDGIGNTTLAGAGDAIFWIQPEANRLEKCATGGCGASSNLRTAVALKSIAVDDKYVYFSTSNVGSVERCPHDGCGLDHVTLATGQDNPHALVATSNAIYWATDANGTTPAAIWRIAR